MKQDGHGGFLAAQADTRGPDSNNGHFQILRALLSRDYLARGDFYFALHDLIEMVGLALGDVSAMVALWHGEPGRWEAITSQGSRLVGEQIRSYASISVLEQVRQSCAPLLSAEDVPLSLSSESLIHNDVASILAVPVFRWERDDDTLKKILFGCLYAHRSSSRPPFDGGDVELVLDVARLAQPVLNVLHRCREIQTELEAAKTELVRLNAAATQEYRLGKYLTRDRRFYQTVLEPLVRAAQSERTTILMLGPSGAGKSYLAEAFHYESRRSKGPLVVLDCSQLTSAETLASELFGYAAESGYHNSPRRGRPGKARLAHGGTLFIDEIGCMPLDLQQRLLRLVERGRFSPLGGGEEQTVDLQIIAATNENLDALVAQKRFREDLFWRLSELSVRIPPLSERPVDIPELVGQFLTRAANRTGRAEIQALSKEAQRVLFGFDWSRSGNLRGLEQVIFRSVLLASPDATVLREADLRMPELKAQPRKEKGYRPSHHPFEPEEQNPSETGRSDSPDIEALKLAIRQHRYATVAAKALGLTHRQLTWRLSRAGLSVRDILAEHG